MCDQSGLAHGEHATEKRMTLGLRGSFQSRHQDVSVIPKPNQPPAENTASSGKRTAVSQAERQLEI